MQGHQRISRLLPRPPYRFILGSRTSRGQPPGRPIGITEIMQTCASNTAFIASANLLRQRARRVFSPTWRAAQRSTPSATRTDLACSRPDTRSESPG